MNKRLSLVTLGLSLSSIVISMQPFTSLIYTLISPPSGVNLTALPNKFMTHLSISVSSQDYGFYYSAENSPITVDCNQDIVCGIRDLAPEGNGYQCVVQGNTFYTEQIKGNIYFYSNAY